jgi:pimeloyl-ACP methyl ester carboxylesterase
VDEARYRQAEQALWESVGRTPAERRVRLDGIGVTVRVLEVGEGEPVVFLTMRREGLPDFAGRFAADVLAALGGPWRGFDPTLTLTEDLLRGVHAPTLMIWGEDDPFGGREVAERLAALLPDARLEMAAGAGHLPWLDDPARAASLTQAFLVG